MFDAKKTLLIALLVLAVGVFFVLREKPENPQIDANKSTASNVTANPADLKNQVDATADKVSIPELKSSKFGGKESLSQIDRMSAKISKEEKKFLEDRGILVNSDKSLSYLRSSPSSIIMLNAIIDTDEVIKNKKDIDIPEAFRAPADTTHHIVQFEQPLNGEQVKQLAAAGAVVDNFIPGRCYSVTASKEAIEQIKSINGVKYIEPYHPYFKMSPDILVKLTGNGNVPYAGEANKGAYRLIPFAGNDVTDKLKELGVKIEKQEKIGNTDVIDVSCDPALLEKLIKIEGVRWVESKYEKKSANDKANVTLRAKPAKWSFFGLDGSGVAVAVCDTGADVTHRAFSVNPALATSNGNTRIIKYEARSGGFGDGLIGDANGHGTHVAGSILGNGGLSDTAIKVPGSGSAPYASTRFAGIATNASLVVIEDFSSFTGAEITKIAYADGARLINNSWRSFATFYGVGAFEWDTYVRDTDTALAGSQELITFFCAGNEGLGSLNDGLDQTAGTIAQEPHAKNVITIGALEQRRQADNIPGAVYYTDTDWQLASYSSIGPTADGRHKPDLVAPGSWVVSAQSKDTDPDSWPTPPPAGSCDIKNGNLDTGPQYAAFMGTSMATPLSTGCGTLLYQYYSNTYNKTPSIAMLKALLINGAENTQSYDYDQAPGSAAVYEGWGLIDLMNSIKGPATMTSNDRKLYDQESSIGMTGTNSATPITYSVADNSGIAGGFKITLVWTDLPGTVGAGAALVNDLDLFVQAPDGSVYIGNDFSRSPWGFVNANRGSYLPAAADRLNNVEQVYIRHAMKGTYKIWVIANQLPQGQPQSYALVVTRGVSTIGDSGGSSPCLALDQNNFPVLGTVNRSGNTTNSDMVGVRHWMGPYGEDSEFNTWRIFRNKWFDYGSNVLSELISGGVSTDYVSEVSVDVNRNNGDVVATWVYHNYQYPKPDVIYALRWNGSNWVQMANSYMSQYGICDSGITRHASSPVVKYGTDGQPVVAYVQNVFNSGTMTLSREIVVKRFNGTSWVKLGNGFVAPGSYAKAVDMIMVGNDPVIAYYDQININIMAYKWNGTVWLPYGGALGGLVSTTSKPKLAVSGSSVYLTWIEQGVDIDANKKTARLAYSSGGGWSSVGNSMNYPGVSGTNAHAYNPQIACANGTVYLAWQSGDAASNSVYLKYWTGSQWSGLNNSDKESIVPYLNGKITLRSLVVHPLGAPIVAVDNQKDDGITTTMSAYVAGMPIDFTQPYFSGIYDAKGNEFNQVTVKWNLIGGSSMQYIIYRSPGSWAPASVPDASDPSVIASVFANPVVTIGSGITSNVFSGLTADVVWYWGVRVRNSQGIYDGNTKLISAGPYSLTGDNDNDWLNVGEELTLGTYPDRVDSDGDGMYDGWEFYYSSLNTGQLAGVSAHTNVMLKLDPLNNGVDNIRTSSPTNDGNPTMAPDYDLDGDGMSNIQEFNYWLTHYRALGIAARTTASNWRLNPTDPDSDRDGMPDGWEYYFNLDPGNPADATGDTDGDGVNNSNEYANGGNPLVTDSDADGLSDGYEFATSKTRLDNDDSDQDGLQDGYELNTAVPSDPKKADSNGNGVSDGDEYQLGYNDVTVPPPGRVMYTLLLTNETFETKTMAQALAAGWRVSSPALQLWHETITDQSKPVANPIYMTTHSTNVSFRCAYDPSAAVGPGFVGTNPAATYNIAGASVYSALDTPRFDASLVNNLYVTWKEWYETENDWDICEVLASTDDLNWTLVRTGVSGYSGGWQTRVADLSAFAGSATLRVRFQFRTLNTVNNAFRGWYVDDIEIYGGGQIFGYVRDINGKPIIRASVYAIGRGGVTNRLNGNTVVLPGHIFGTGTADAYGYYEINGLPRGRYYIKAVAPTYQSEFWNGWLYGTDMNPLQYYNNFLQPPPPPWGYPGVSELSQAVNGYVTMIAPNALQEADFELAKGASRGSLAVLSPAVGRNVYLDQLSTSEVLWNGYTNPAAYGWAPYLTTNTFNISYPDWYTNNMSSATPVKPLLLQDVEDGDHVVYLNPPMNDFLPEMKAPVRGGELTQVYILTNVVNGNMAVSITGLTLSASVYIDNRDSGKIVTGGSSAQTFYLPVGEHQITLWAGSSNLWVAPKWVTVPAMGRTNIAFTSNEITQAGMGVTVVATDVNNLPVINAKIYIDGMPLTSNETSSTGTPYSNISNIKAGQHWLTARKNGYLLKSKQYFIVSAGTTNTVPIVMSASDMDYDGVSDSLEADGYTNIFKYAGTDDPDGDGLNNATENDISLYRGVLLNLAKADSDDDSATDKEEVDFDGIVNRLGLSSLINANGVGSSRADVYFAGKFLAGISDMPRVAGKGVSIEGDLFMTTGVPPWTCDTYNTPGYRYAVLLAGPTNQIISFNHNQYVSVYSDPRPDTKDTDGDGMWDGWEMRYYTNALNTSKQLNPIEKADIWADPDNDGLANINEFLGADRTANTNDCCNPFNPDTDGDGMPDGWEFNHGLKPNDPSDAAADPDNDQLTNLDEFRYGVDPHNADSDNDGLLDGVEVNKYRSDPAVADTDMDGLLDGQEVYDTDGDPSNGIDGGFFPGWNGGDMDMDGYVDGPTDWDTDGDGMPDGFEVKDLYGNIRPEGSRLNPADPTDANKDFDGDNLSNLQEYLVRDNLYGNHPKIWDPVTYGGIVWDYSTDPFNADTDGDGMPDGFEVMNGLFATDPIQIQPGGNPELRERGLYLFGDLDGDGVANTNEYSVRFINDPNANSNTLYGSTHPWVADTDADGLRDGYEIKKFGVNPLEQDSDADGVADGNNVSARSAEVNTGAGSGLGAYSALITNDMWVLIPPTTLLPPSWSAVTVTNNPYTPPPVGPVYPQRPICLYGASLVRLNYSVSDTGGVFISRSVGITTMPGEQTLLKKIYYVLIGGCNDNSDNNMIWIFGDHKNFQAASPITFGSWAIATNSPWPLPMMLDGPYPITGYPLTLDGIGPAGRSFMCAGNMPSIGSGGGDTGTTRPRPGGTPGYKYFTYSPTTIVEPWGTLGVENMENITVIGGWTSGNDYRPNSDCIEQYTEGGWNTHVPVNLRVNDFEEIGVRFGWRYLKAAYEWDIPTNNFYFYAFNNQYRETIGRTPPNPTGSKSKVVIQREAGGNFTYTGINIRRVMNTANDYALPRGSRMNAILTVTFDNPGGAADVNLYGELATISQPTLEDSQDHDTLSSAMEYFTEVGQDPAGSPKDRYFNSSYRTAVPMGINIPGPGTTTMNLDVTRLVNEMFNATAGGGDIHWEIGNNLGFIITPTNAGAPFGPILLSTNQNLYITVTNMTYWEKGRITSGDTPVDFPFERKSGTMQYMPSINNFVLFGGVDRVQALQDTWIGNNNGGWSLFPITEPAPPPRWGHCSAVNGNYMFVFGGFDSHNKALNDLWVFDGTSWSEAFTMADDHEIPPPRGGASMGTCSDFIMLFGGTDGEKYFNDTWMLTAVGLTPVENANATFPPYVKWILIYPDSPRATLTKFPGLPLLPVLGKASGPCARAFAATADDCAIYGGRYGTLPGAEDTDQDTVSDGLEMDLGGPCTTNDRSRDPSINRMYFNDAPGAPNYNVFEAIPYTYNQIRNKQNNGIWFEDFESLEYDPCDDQPIFNAFHGWATGMRFPIEGHRDFDNTNAVIRSALTTNGFDAAGSDMINLWWHCFNRDKGLATDNRDSWKLGAPYKSAGMPSNAIPSRAHGGRWCYGTKLDGYYDDDSDMELYSPLINLTMGGVNPNSYYLMFYEWLDLGDENDVVRVEALRPQLPSEINQRLTSPSKPVISILPNRNYIENTKGKWRKVVISLDSIANEPNIYLRFVLQSDSQTHGGGWYIDDVAVVQGGNIQGTYTPGTANAPIYLYGINSTNWISRVTSGTGGNFGFEMLPAGFYAVASPDQGWTIVTPFGGPAGWNITGVAVNLNEIVLGITINSPAKLRWNSVPGLTYLVQYSTPSQIMTASPWTTLAEVTATGTVSQHIDLESDIYKSRFYRIILKSP